MPAVAGETLWALDCCLFLERTDVCLRGCSASSDSSPQSPLRRPTARTVPHSRLCQRSGHWASSSRSEPAAACPVGFARFSASFVLLSALPVGSFLASLCWMPFLSLCFLCGVSPFPCVSCLWASQFDYYSFHFCKFYKVLFWSAWSFIILSRSPIMVLISFWIIYTC